MTEDGSGRHRGVGQQSPAHDPPGAAANTWQPVYGAEVAARGRFDDQAHAHSLQLWVSQHRRLVTAASLVAAAALAARAGRA